MRHTSTKKPSSGTRQEPRQAHQRSSANQCISRPSNAAYPAVYTWLWLVLNLERREWARLTVIQAPEPYFVNGVSNGMLGGKKRIKAECASDGTTERHA
jgi:hypothetical protein